MDRQFFRTFRNRTESWYKKLEHVCCPALEKNIYFTSVGFRHLTFSNSGKPRNTFQQYLRLSLLRFVPKSISLVKKVYEIRAKGKYQYYALVQDIEEVGKIRVIVSRKSAGRIVFLSVMPHGEKTKKRL